MPVMVNLNTKYEEPGTMGGSQKLKRWLHNHDCTPFGVFYHRLLKLGMVICVPNLKCLVSPFPKLGMAQNSKKDYYHDPI